jgi:hypothetical protein
MRRFDMPRKGHTEEQIIAALKQRENGETTADICRKLSVSQATFCWILARLNRPLFLDIRHIRLDITGAVRDVLFLVKLLVVLSGDETDVTR